MLTFERSGEPYYPDKSIISLVSSQSLSKRPFKEIFRTISPFPEGIFLNVDCSFGGLFGVQLVLASPYAINHRPS